MPASRRRAAARRVATPSASGCKARCLSLAERADFAAFPTERLRLALRIATTPERGRRWKSENPGSLVNRFRASNDL